MGSFVDLKNERFGRLMVKSRNLESKVNYKYIFLGYYDNFDDAVCARRKAEAIYFGEFSGIGKNDKGEINFGAEN